MCYLMYIGNYFNEISELLEKHGYTFSKSDNNFLLIVPERKRFERISYVTAIEFRELFNGYKFITLGQLRDKLED